jgi:hypothetical protein
MPIRELESWIPVPGIRAAVVFFLALITPAAGAARAGLPLEILRGEGSNDNALHGPAIFTSIDWR